MGLLMALCPRLGRCAAGVQLRTFRSGLVLWAGAHLSLDGAWAQHMGAQSKKILVVSWRSGQEASTEDGGYTSLVLPRPLPGGTTRHAAAYHPCQPSPPGNVAAFSATPSGVPAAPQNTAAGGWEGAGAHPRARKKRQVPLPHVLSDWRWTGGWEGAAGSAGLGTEGRVTARAVPACPLPCLLPHSTLSARSTGPPRIPAFLPFTSNQSRQPLLALLRPSLFTCWTTRLGGPGDAAKWLGHGHLGSHSLAPHRWPFGGKSSALPQHTCPHQSYLEHGDVGGKCLARCPSGCLNGMEVYRFMCGVFFFFLV